MLATTIDRVAENTSEERNRKIELETEKNIAYYRERPELIEARLGELSQEWDIERALETMASIGVLTSITLGKMGLRPFKVVPYLIAGFLLWHNVQGWCPPLPILRAMGFRTAFEIDRERYALKAALGDVE